MNHSGENFFLKNSIKWLMKIKYIDHDQKKNNLVKVKEVISLRVYMVEVTLIANGTYIRMVI